ncbi:hypothetical protein DEA8626_02878 [Defluviimonas aquaemixtae]|uniref:Uncharacterized protein n=1 Tax=Albidovulum aquaemixtae TaxID=1542388 RepID=A0A2R8BK89_9RHOB|nr:hypothetical protein [Defluviimonas aquaemixtae]SPH23806.1 hypothetical protein DEA8626_02878 [Defluviimonas aquaemixtae]
MTGKTIPLLALIALLAAEPASAACRVEYKAKRDNPLKLDFGVASLPDSACASKQAAAAALAPKLAQQGWTLLAIVSILASK